MAHHHHHRHAPKPSAGTGRRVALILVAGGITAGIVSLLSAPPRRSIAPPPPPQLMGKMSPTRLQDYAADNAVVQGALAGDRAIVRVQLERGAEAAGEVPAGVRDVDPVGTRRVSVPTGSRPPHERGPGRAEAAVRLTQVRSVSPHETRDRALADALAVARDRLLLEFREMDPPVRAIPTTDDIRANYLRPESVTEVHPSKEVQDAWRASNLDANRVWVEIDVEVTEDQLRELRSGYRLGWAGWGTAAVLIVVAALHGFLRIDAWTKGYLTTALALAAAAAAGGGVAVLYLVR